MFQCLESLVCTMYMRLCTFTTSSELVGIHISFVVIFIIGTPSKKILLLRFRGENAPDFCSAGQHFIPLTAHIKTQANAGND